MTRRWLSLADMRLHRAAWADLAARALEPNPFSEPAFAAPAARLLPGAPPRFLLAWDPRIAGRLIGLCCIEAPSPLLPTRAWLHPQATAAFPLLDAEQPLLAFNILLAQTGGLTRPPGLLLSGVPVEGATMQAARGHGGWVCAVIAERSRAILHRDPGPMAGKAGKEFRRQARRLEELGPVTIGGEASPERLEAFLELESRGWKGRNGTALAALPGLARFAREMVLGFVEERRCRIYSLDLHGKPIAMGLILQSGSGSFFWKTAFDEAYGRFSPGSHLAEAIGRAEANRPDLRLVDSCAIPNHTMIDRLWSERMTVADVFIAPAPALTLRQRQMLRIERARRSARDWAKRRFAARQPLRHNPDEAQP